MPLQLVLSVRLHDSRYHGASEWPPAPARLFQALIAGAGLGGPLEEAERAALKWLERLDPPVIGAPKKWDCSGFVLYVPNNDLDRVGGDPRLIGKVRTARKEIKPKLFDSRIPFAYAWTIDENQQGRRHAYVTCALAERLYQFGRGVDFAWAWGEMIDDQSVADFLSRYPGRVYRPSGRRNGGGGTLKCPEEGSLESLELRYATSRQRFSVGNGDDGVVRFVQPPKPRFRLIGYDSPPSRLMFDLRETSATASFALWPADGGPDNQTSRRSLRQAQSCYSEPCCNDRARVNRP